MQPKGSCACAPTMQWGGERAPVIKKKPPSRVCVSKRGVYVSKRKALFPGFTWKGQANLRDHTLQLPEEELGISWSLAMTTAQNPWYRFA